MRDKRGRRRRTVKKPNGALYFAGYILLYPFFKLFFQMEVDRSGYSPPEGPFLVLSNHRAYMDFILVMLALYPHRLNAVTAQRFFFYRPLHRLLPFMGCIPKIQFAPDVRAVKGIMEVIKRGDKVLLFPEGRSTTDGAYMGALKATGKFVKKLEVPVVSSRIEGAYTCTPFWRRGVRRGPVRVTLANLFDGEDARRLTVEELNSRINARLSGADAKIPDKAIRLRRARRLAEGLDNVLYLCPACKREFTLEAKGNVIRCTACDNAASMDRSSKLSPLAGSAVPETIHKWYREQIEHELQSIHAQMEAMEIAAHVWMPAASGVGLEACGQGTLLLDAKGWRYEGELRGAAVSLDFPIETVPVVSFDLSNNLHMYANGNLYQFKLEHKPGLCAKYALIGECIYWRHSPFIQITEGYFSGHASIDHMRRSSHGEKTLGVEHRA